ncbi:MAG: CHRD domain-containing protein [Alphaproteobacteria bacterium]|nr:CHRD domain-containing protein [Alphaproteobacteria bacterium]
MQIGLVRLAAATAVAGLLAISSASAQNVSLRATLNGAQEVPAVTTAGNGTATFTFNPATRALEYEITYTGLSGPATGAHIHGPAAAGANAGVMVPFASPASPIRGTANLNEQQATELLAGRTYVNIHTAANGGGEIRGQITR